MDAFGKLFLHRLDCVRQKHGEENLSCGVLKSAEPVQFDLQKGPSCGPVSQIIVSKIFGLKALTPDDIINYNKEKSFTSAGECFSVDWMKMSCLHFFPELECSSEDFPSSAKIISQLNNSSLYLIPYDSDKDNAPTLRNGLSAHWCVVIGYFLMNYVEHTDNSSAEVSENNVYLITYQGKSRTAGLFDYIQLRDSNAQLNTYENKDMIMDIGGIQAGLKGRAVHIKGREGHHMKIVNFRM